MKKFAKREKVTADGDGDMTMMSAAELEERLETFVELKMRTEYFVDHEGGEGEMKVNGEAEGGGEGEAEEGAGEECGKGTRRR